MTLADIPGDQSVRLEELKGYNILDTETGPDFDALVALVARLLDVPTALISFVDDSRQWFKARVGLDVAQTDLESSICSHAILHDDLTEIPDTLDDDRTRDNPLCSGMTGKMRFYAGAPLITPTGRAIGTLCVLDDKPRVLTDLQRDVLRVMAQQVMKQLDLHRALAAEEVLRDEIDHRVKNSLQTVSSFLRIYRSRADHDETRDILQAVDRRVTAVAELHAALYQSNSHKSVSLSEYLDRMVVLLQSQAPAGIVLEITCAPLTVSPQVASSLALIISEFAANAFKHAFPEGAGGVVSIAVSEDAGSLVLICRDNGTGGESKGPIDASTGIGIRLMEASAEQIGGTMNAGPQPGGYCLDLTVPLEPAP
ncbi:histidine kinase dimerization/phosphoacceptor domain -containing protein [Primorskyibacter sp. 2E107]|uniref:histidine kinase dimerization/phosphoacceptor domain -containing protein n=1 Tax=Primorskyibacter sp. 2E107 TaxID=3403458 RepID=UPI003AF8A540